MTEEELIPELLSKATMKKMAVGFKDSWILVGIGERIYKKEDGGYRLLENFKDKVSDEDR